MQPTDGISHVTWMIVDRGPMIPDNSCVSEGRQEGETLDCVGYVDCFSTRANTLLAEVIERIP